MHERLIANLRNRVRTGQLTERGLAKLTGLSQPHIHNVLKGARSLSIVYADRILDQLNLSIVDLLTETGPLQADPTATVVRVPWLRGKVGPQSHLGIQTDGREMFPVPHAWATSLSQPAMVQFAADPSLYPYYQAGDIGLADLAVPAIEALTPVAMYLVRVGTGTLLRSIRVGGNRLYLVTPNTAHEPRLWDSLPLPFADLSPLIQGRVVWIIRRSPVSL